MKKVLFFACLFIFSITLWVPCANSSRVFANNNTNNSLEYDRRITIDEALVLEATSQVLDSFGVFVQEAEVKKEINICPKKRRRDRRKRFWKKLLTVVVNFAAKVAAQELVGSFGRSHASSEYELAPEPCDCSRDLIEICHVLYEILELDGHTLPHEAHTPCLHCIFSLEDKAKREQALTQRFMGSPEQVKLFLQELFSTLFYYSSERLTELQTSFYKRVIMKFRSYNQDQDQEQEHKEEPFNKSIMRSLNNKEIDSNPNNDVCFACHSAVARILEQTQVKSLPQDSRVSVSGVISILQIISMIGDLVFCKEEEGENNKAVFVKKTLVLVKKLYKYLSDEGLVSSLKRLSVFLEKLDKASGEQEWDFLIKEFLGSLDKGLLFLEETFSHLNIYLNEALAKAFSHMFRQVSQTIYE